MLQRDIEIQDDGTEKVVDVQDFCHLREEHIRGCLLLTDETIFDLIKVNCVDASGRLQINCATAGSINFLIKKNGRQNNSRPYLSLEEGNDF